MPIPTICEIELDAETLLKKATFDVVDYWADRPSVKQLEKDLLGRIDDLIEAINPTDKPVKNRLPNRRLKLQFSNPGQRENCCNALADASMSPKDVQRRRNAQVVKRKAQAKRKRQDQQARLL